MSNKLSEKEFKKLIIDVARSISPVMVQQENDVKTNAKNIALYAKQIAKAVNKVLADKES